MQAAIFALLVFFASASAATGADADPESARDAARAALAEQAEAPEDMPALPDAAADPAEGEVARAAGRKADPRAGLLPAQASDKARAALAEKAFGARGSAQRAAHSAAAEVAARAAQEAAARAATGSTGNAQSAAGRARASAAKAKAKGAAPSGMPANLPSADASPGRR